jgi:hypothetical protein
LQLLAGADLRQQSSPYQSPKTMAI